MRRFQVFSGFALKWIAIVSMVIDHFGSIVLDGVLAPYWTDGQIAFTADMPLLIRSVPMMKTVCDALGSAAFPIFCFLLVEGFLHTHSRLQYGLRMGLFALISELPFNLAHRQTLLYPGLQNVLFTLCIGIFTLCAMAWAEKKLTGRKALLALSLAGVILSGASVAYLIRSEYVFLGIFCIAALYLLRKNRWVQLLGFCPLLIASPWILLALPPVAAYNGQRGRGTKYFFYVFYPAHFLLFYGVARLLARR